MGTASCCTNTEIQHKQTTDAIVQLNKKINDLI